MFRTNLNLTFQSKNFKKSSLSNLKDIQKNKKNSKSLYEFLGQINLIEKLNELDRDGITLIGPIPKYKDH